MDRIALVLGTGPTLRSDLIQWYMSGLGDNHSFDVVAINRAGCFYKKPIKIWATQHPFELSEWFSTRLSLQGNLDFEVYSTVPAPLVDHVFKYEGPSGSSALLGTLVAIEKGFQKVILLGCPLNNLDYSGFRPGWIFQEKVLRGKVKAFSGFIQGRFGNPTKEWVCG